MLRHAIAPSRRYTKAAHDVVRHPRLGSDAKVLLLHVQGLPEDQAGQALSEHAKNLGITGRAYQKAKKQLAENGFVHERRRQVGRGHWATDQLCSNVPLVAEQARRVLDGLVVAPAPQPSEQERTVGQPGIRAVGDSLPVEEEREKNYPHPPSEADPESEVEPGRDSTPAPELNVTERLLLSLRHATPQLHLGVREARGLAELAAEWIRRGITTTDLRRALTSELPPEGVRSAVGFLRHRLVQKLPEPPAPTDARPAAPPRVRELVPWRRSRRGSRLPGGGGRNTLRPVPPGGDTGILGRPSSRVRAAASPHPLARTSRLPCGEPGRDRLKGNRRCIGIGRAGDLGLPGGKATWGPAGRSMLDRVPASG